MEQTLEKSQALIGAVEAARRLGISRKTLYRYTKEGTVPIASTLPSGVFRYSPETLEILRKAWEVEDD